MSSFVQGQALANLRRTVYASRPEEKKSPFMPELSPELLALGFIWYLAFLFSTTCHAAAHALAAKIGGGNTAPPPGRVFLNPFAPIPPPPSGACTFSPRPLSLTRTLSC